MPVNWLRVLPMRLLEDLSKGVRLSVGLALLGAFIASSHMRQSMNLRHAEANYDCSVDDMYTIGEDGALRRSNYAPLAKGDRFIVSGLTGQIVGPWLTTAKAVSTQVLREGDDTGWAFEAMAEFSAGANRTAQVIHIKRYRPGPRKLREFQQLASIYASSCHPMLGFAEFPAEPCRTLLAQMLEFVVPLGATRTLDLCAKAAVANAIWPLSGPRSC